MSSPTTIAPTSGANPLPTPDPAAPARPDNMTLATGWIPALDKIFVPQTTVTQDQLQAGTMVNRQGSNG
jgi:hypothetical protein